MQEATKGVEDAESVNEAVAAPNSFAPNRAASPLGDALEQYIAWVNAEGPAPTKSASDVSLAAEKSRRGSKRKLGVRR